MSAEIWVGQMFVQYEVEASSAQEAWDEMKRREDELKKSFNTDLVWARVSPKSDIEVELVEVKP